MLYNMDKHIKYVTAHISTQVYRKTFKSSYIIYIHTPYMYKYVPMNYNYTKILYKSYIGKWLIVDTAKVQYGTFVLLYKIQKYYTEL